ncbi:MAG: ribonuclease P protein component [Balneolaceae bacterium]|nr:ribonuclease P protein component [Balneolaceae bacterium]MDR9446358.1 ribonuclease P protein component [Balneolaceae bacterium]
MKKGQSSQYSRLVGQRLRLPRAAILRGKERFQTLFSSSTVLRQPHVQLRFRVSPSSEPSQQTAFVVSKRHGNAVTRNRLKRQMRECYRRNQHAWRMEPDLQPTPHRSNALAVDALFMIQSSHVEPSQLETEMLTLMANGQERLKTWVHG